MKKIILCLILIGFLRAFIDMPEGWRQRKSIYMQNAYGIPRIGTWICGKGDTFLNVFVKWSLQDPQLLYFTYSQDAGFTWTQPFAVDPENIYRVYHPRIIMDRTSFIYVTFQQLMDEEYYIIQVYGSPDFGNTWIWLYSAGSSGLQAYSPWCDCKGDTFAIVYEEEDGNRYSHIYFTYRENGGSFINREDLGIGDSPRIIIDAGDSFYVFGNFNGILKLAKRTGVNQWQFFTFPESQISLEEPNRVMRADPQSPGVIHFIYSYGGQVYYRKFVNSTWSDPVLIAAGQKADFVVDFQGRIYTVIGTNLPNNNYELKYYVSFNGGNTWKYMGTLYNSKYFCYEKYKRGRGLALVNASDNDYGILQFQGNDDYPVSNRIYATAYNNNKHLVRIPNSDDLYAVFSMHTDSPDVVAVRSLDGGVNWENYKVIGHGAVGTPCIWFDPTLPDIVTYLWRYLSDTILQYRTYTISTGSWSSIYNLGLPTNIATPRVSMCRTKRRVTVIPKDLLIVALHGIWMGNEESPAVFVIEYDITNPNTPEVNYWMFPEQALNPSISYSWVNGTLKYHCVYEAWGGKIYYREKLYGNSYSWTDPFPISHLDKIAKDPSIEVYGDSLYVVWSEPESNGKHDVWRRRKKVTDPHNQWSDLERVSSINGDDYDSRYPTNSELKFTLWNEEDHNNTGEYDPWFRYNDDPPMVFYNTAEHSYFPHGNRYLTSFHIWLYGIWTEKDHLLYRILSHKREYIPIGGESSYLTYSGGENSPYLIEREGIKDYGNIRVDIGQNLIYEFLLDTIYNY
ncbi:MAG: hypothetical protein ABIN23_08495, partial [candidate division WOR-3 bacterium]